MHWCTPPSSAAVPHHLPLNFNFFPPTSHSSLFALLVSSQRRLLALHHGRTASRAQLCAWRGRRWSGDVREERVVWLFDNVRTNLLCDVVRVKLQGSDVAVPLSLTPSLFRWAWSRPSHSHRPQQKTNLPQLYTETFLVTVLLALNR